MHALSKTYGGRPSAYAGVDLPDAALAIDLEALRVGNEAEEERRAIEEAKIEAKRKLGGTHGRP